MRRPEQNVGAWLGGLLLVAACGCAQPVTEPDPAGPLSLSIPFEARLGDQPFSCSEPMAMADGSSLRARDLRLFIHDVAVADESGNEHPVAVKGPESHVVDGVVLLDFEDRTGSCERGSEALFTTLAFEVPDGAYTGLSFAVGVPFEQNHANPALASGPLALGGMHWSWQAGYKFLRFDADREGGAGVRVHLGSTGCTGTMTAVEGCARPNRARVSLARLPSDGQAVVLHLDRLIGELTEARDGSCMSAPGDLDCLPALEALALDVETGLPTGPTGAFSVAAR